MPPGCAVGGRLPEWQRANSCSRCRLTEVFHKLRVVTRHPAILEHHERPPDVHQARAKRARVPAAVTSVASSTGELTVKLQACCTAYSGSAVFEGESSRPVQ